MRAIYSPHGMMRSICVRNSFFLVRTCASSSLRADRLICLSMSIVCHIFASFTLCGIALYNLPTKIVPLFHTDARLLIILKRSIFPLCCAIQYNRFMNGHYDTYTLIRIYHRISLGIMLSGLIFGSALLPLLFAFCLPFLKLPFQSVSTKEGYRFCRLSLSRINSGI